MSLQVGAKPVDGLRDSKSSNQLAFDLTSKIYRTETYQAPYVVDVPYQEQETYYESIPYEETETYTDYEEYWERERVCKDERRTDQKCEQVRKCRPNIERRCETRKVCQLQPAGAIKGFMALLWSETAFAQRGGGDGDRERRDREDQERRQKDENDRREQDDNSRRQREDHDRRQRDDNDRRQRDEDNRRERDDNSRRQREEHDRRQRDDNDRRQRDEHDRRQRDEHDRRNRDERDRRERDERGRRDREDRDRRNRDENCQREVCTDVKVGETCRDEKVCHPTTRRERVCRDESVRKTRPVTKTRQVTKYRDELRTRTVTRYRQEERCCVTKERKVLDRTLSAQVVVEFPAEASLEANEREVFQLELVETEGRSDLSVQFKQSIYSYQPVVQKISENQFVVKMQVIPTYDSAELGDPTIADVTLTSLGKAVRLNFLDKGVLKKVKTDYVIQLIDSQSGVEIGSQAIQDHRNPRATFVFNYALQPQAPVLARIQVQRSGVVLSAPLSFVAERALAVAAEEKYDPTAYKDKTKVGKFSLGGSRQDLVVYFRDLTEDIPQVQSQYQFQISLGSRVLAEKIFDRSELQVDSSGRYALPVATGFGVSEADLALLKSGVSIVIQGNVIRNGTRFAKGQFIIPKKVILKID